MDLIDETISHGSIIYALNNDIIKKEELLNYYAETSKGKSFTSFWEEIRYFSGYVYLCSLIREIQYINDQHFLSYASDELSIIYVVFCKIFDVNSLTLPIDRITPTNNLSSLIEERNLKRWVDNEDIYYKIVVSFFIALDINISNSEEIHDRLVSSTGFSLAFRRIIEQYREEFQKDYLQFDIPDFINDNNKIIQRMRFLKDNCPNYFERIAKGIYLSYFNIHPPLYEESLILHNEFSFEGPKGKFISTIENLPFTVKAYVLGFPINYSFPSEDEVSSSIRHFNELIEKEGAEKGIEQYSIEIRNYNRRFLTILQESSGILPNETDTLTNRIDDYNLFDVMVFHGKNAINYFTRKEFPFILKKKENPYNREKISDDFSLFLKERQNLASKLKLPGSCPIVEFLNDLNRGKSLNFETPEHDQDTSSFDQEISEVINGVFGSMSGVSPVDVVLPMGDIFSSFRMANRIGQGVDQFHRLRYHL